jgi:NAD(P)-dependent dehydrogenase (short-subunit alcohol dehydrogenase family)
LSFFPIFRTIKFVNEPVADRWVAGKTVLVTGATDGIGRETARALLRAGATVIVHGRDEERCEATRREIASDSDRVLTLVADFASLEGVRRCARSVAEQTAELHVVVNNAGVYMRRRQLTPDGLEMTFAVNHIAPFLLTALLLPLLLRAPSARVITVSSVAHTRARLEFDNLQAERTFDPYQAYALSKLGNLLFSAELAERLAGTHVTSNALHPGVVATKLLREGFPGSVGQRSWHGAVTPVYLASSPAVEGVTGKYFVDRKVREPSPLVRDATLRSRFWTVSAALAGAEPRP